MNARRLWITCVAMAGLILAAGGCSDSEEVGTDATGLMAPSASVDASIPIPTLSDLESGMKLTPEQRSAMETALASWRQSMETRNAEREQRRQRGPMARGERPDFADHESPVFAFLEKSAEILEPGQFTQLTETLAQRREAHREAMAGRREGRFGPGKHRKFDRPGRGDRGQERLEQLTEELDLTDEQQSAVQEAMDAMHEAMQEHHEQCRNSDVPRQECREQAREIHEQYRAQLEEILEPEQLERLEERRAGRRAEMTERMETHAEQRMERMLGFLTRILDLDDSQTEQVRGILEGAQEQVRALHEQVRSGELEREDAWEQMEEIREASMQAIRDILTPEQQGIFEALHALLPAHGPGFGHGPGHGFGGPCQ